MKKGLIFLAVIIILPLAAGCAGGSGGVELGEEFILNVGQAVAIQGEDLSIKFIGVTDDSRCPQGVQCIQAGEASAIVEIEYRDHTYLKRLVQPGASEDTQETFEVYTVDFNILPYPMAGTEIEPGQYRLVLMVERSG